MILKLIKAGVATVALLTISVAAQAADVPVKAPYYKSPLRSVVSYYNWTGFYVGINGGYGFGTGSLEFPPTSFSPKGFLFGGTIGYNYQFGSWVLGLEGDFDWSMVKGSATCGLATCELANPWLGTARARVGYAFDRWLPYLTGGAAFGQVKLSDPFSSVSKMQIGYTFGGGLEYAFLGNWSAKVEYLYVNLGQFDCGTSCLAPVTPNNIAFKESVVRVGLNYKFSGPLLSRF